MLTGPARQLAQRTARRAFSWTAAARTTPTNPLDPTSHPHPTSTPPPGPPPGPSASSSAASSSSTTHFGFRDVPEQLKESLVRGVFSSVASSYDVMNDAMSLGIHRLWKDHYVSKLDPHGGLRCLDVAGGTGDIAVRILDHAREKYGDRELSVKMLDINPEMLEEGKKRFARTMYHGSASCFSPFSLDLLPFADQRLLVVKTAPQVDFTLGNAEDLSTIESSSLDLYTIAFGIRNCTHIDRVLAEAYRVLKPGGVFSCLEFSKVTNPVLAKAYELYSFNVIPPLGHVLAADRDSYQYLVESIERFPQQDVFAGMIRDAGFTVPQEEPYENLTFGIAAIHTGVKV
ncbi:SPOSA6832_01030, partial [Sporobolomyces salmonicolor]